MDKTWALLFLGCLFLASPSLNGTDSNQESEPSRERLVRITTERDGARTHFYAENLQLANITVTIELQALNLDSDAGFPYTKSLGGYQRKRLFSLTHSDQDKPWKWSYTYYSTWGCMDAEHDHSYIYTLPYASGKRFRVSQGYHGHYSHFGANAFSIDWSMPVGTPVHAAREGVVVALKEDSDRGGPDKKYDWDANFILIRHPDGTLGHYVHLQHKGVHVKLGQHVDAGDLIGRSGNTGHSTGPHLHFAVFKGKTGKQRETLPVRYWTSASHSEILRDGRSYTAPTRRPNLGSPSIEVVHTTPAFGRPN
jgi:murein DD-endopeptidase MepM/ murein hydrolase activator NlpD